MTADGDIHKHINFIIQHKVSLKSLKISEWPRLQDGASAIHNHLLPLDGGEGIIRMPLIRLFSNEAPIARLFIILCPSLSFNTKTKRDCGPI